MPEKTGSEEVPLEVKKTVDSEIKENSTKKRKDSDKKPEKLAAPKSAFAKSNTANFGDDEKDAKKEGKCKQFYIN